MIYKIDDVTRCIVEGLVKIYQKQTENGADSQHSLDNIKHELEEFAEDLLTIFQLEAHVERLHVSQVLQEVEVPLKSGVFWVLQAPQLLD